MESGLCHVAVQELRCEVTDKDDNDLTIQGLD